MSGRLKFVLSGIGVGMAVWLLFSFYVKVTEPSPTSVALSQPAEPESALSALSADAPSETIAALPPMAKRSTPHRSQTSLARKQAGPSPTPNDAVEYAETPTVFSEPDYTSGRWSQEQLDILYRLRQEFTTAVVGSNLNPASPDYFEKWQEQALLSDQKFQEFFGTDAYLRERQRPRQ